MAEPVSCGLGGDTTDSRRGDFDRIGLAHSGLWNGSAGWARKTYGGKVPLVLNLTALPPWTPAAAPSFRAVPRD